MIQLQSQLSQAIMQFNYRHYYATILSLNKKFSSSNKAVLRLQVNINSCCVKQSSEWFFSFNKFLPLIY